MVDCIYDCNCMVSSSVDLCTHGSRAVSAMKCPVAGRHTKIKLGICIQYFHEMWYNVFVLLLVYLSVSGVSFSSSSSSYAIRHKHTHTPLNRTDSILVLFVLKNN